MQWNPQRNRVLRLRLASALLVLAFAAPCSADTQHIHIQNFGQVSPTYYRGSQPVDGDYADLASLGVKTIINLTSDDASGDEPALAARAGLKYVQIPMTTRVAPTPKQLAEFFKAVDDPANQPVFVHCVGGRHRTGVMTAVYRMTEEGWTSAQAFKEMQHFGFGAAFLHPEFKAFVYSYPAMMAHVAAATAATRAGGH